MYRDNRQDLLDTFTEKAREHQVLACEAYHAGDFTGQEYHEGMVEVFAQLADQYR